MIAMFRRTRVGMSALLIELLAIRKALDDIAPLPRRRSQEEFSCQLNRAIALAERISAHPLRETNESVDTA